MHGIDQGSSRFWRIEVCLNGSVMPGVPCDEGSSLGFRPPCRVKVPRIVRAKGCGESPLLAGQSRGIGSLGKQFCGKSLGLRDPLDFNRNCVD
jgi:hypothetical protein